jgi:hypothetical protein
MSNGLFESYVWVRRDVLQEVYKEGSLSPNWKPSRKRGRDSWQWVKAKIVAASASTPTSSSRNSNGTPDAESSPNSPFGQVKLRRVRRSVAAPSQRNLTVLVDDPDAGRFHQQNFTFETKTSDGYVVNANAWWQQQSNGSRQSTTAGIPPQDLTELNHLHEAAVVYCLKRRYEEEQIYTYTGRVLLALNPFCQIRNLYGQQVITKYQQAANRGSDGNKPPPHVYATAQDAYSSMMMEGNHQSILVSGESGAGKTVTTKIILGYLTTLSKWKGAAFQARRVSNGGKASASTSVGIESQGTFLLVSQSW